MVFEKKQLNRLILKSALRHQLVPTNGFFQVGINPIAQLIEQLLLTRGQPLFPVLVTGGFEQHHFSYG